jgi:uncharacterized protein
VKQIPDEVTSLIGVPQYEEEGEFPVERGYIWTVASSVENGNPLYWDDEAAAEITGGPIAPPTMISAWLRPHHWAPGRKEQKLAIQLHFDLKRLLDTPEAIMSENTLIFFEPVRIGDRVTTVQVLRNVSEEKTLKLGTGHFWDIDIEYRNQSGDLCCRESITGFGYNRPGSAS